MPGAQRSLFGEARSGAARAEKHHLPSDPAAARQRRPRERLRARLAIAQDLIEAIIFLAYRNLIYLVLVYPLWIFRRVRTVFSWFDSGSSSIVDPCPSVRTLSSPLRCHLILRRVCAVLYNYYDPLSISLLTIVRALTIFAR